TPRRAALGGAAARGAALRPGVGRDRVVIVDTGHGQCARSPEEQEGADPGGALHTAAKHLPGEASGQPEATGCRRASNQAATSSKYRSRYSEPIAEAWGRTWRFGVRQSGESAGKGSSGNTSR